MKIKHKKYIILSLAASIFLSIYVCFSAAQVKAFATNNEPQDTPLIQNDNDKATFDCNGGKFSDGSDAITITQNLYPGATYNTPNEIPIKENYVFMGWWTQPDGGWRIGRASQIEYKETETGIQYIVIENLYARWTPGVPISITADEGHNFFKYSVGDYEGQEKITATSLNSNIPLNTRFIVSKNNKEILFISTFDLDFIVGKLEAIPLDNYVIDKWFKNGELLNEGEIYTINDQSKGISLNASYKSTLPTPVNPQIEATTTAQTDDSLSTLATDLIIIFLASAIYYVYARIKSQRK